MIFDKKGEYEEMKKRILAVMLTICLLLCSVSTASFSASAESYGDFWYTVSNGKVTITRYNGDATDVVVPASINGYPVTALQGTSNGGHGAFRNLDTNITSITLPESIEEIGPYAFENCIHLSRVNISDIAKWCNISFGYDYSNPVYYSHNLYLNNNKVTSVTILEGTTTINSYAFQGLQSLTRVTIPNSVKEIHRYAFDGCTGLSDISIPNSVTTIGESAFKNCTGFTSISIPNSVTSIGESAFEGCSALVNVNIPNNLKEIENNTFCDCKSISNIVVPNSVTRIGNYAFSNCKSLEQITMGNGVTVVGVYAFYYCSSLEKVNISDISKWLGITFWNMCANPLGNKAEEYFFIDELRSKAGLYLNGELVTDLIVPEGTTSIGRSAFEGYGKLKSVSIPSSVKYINENAFSTGSKLSKVNITDVEKWCNIYFQNENTNPLSSSENLYINGNLITDLVIPDGVKQVSSYAFAGCEGLKSVKIPTSVTDIGYMAFDGVETIYGYKGTKAEKYAETNKINFIDLDSISNVKYGDVDGDGVVTVKDALMTLQAYVKTLELNDSQKIAADVDGESGVSIKDALLILQYFVGIVTKFPVEM